MDKIELERVIRLEEGCCPAGSDSAHRCIPSSPQSNLQDSFKRFWFLIQQHFFAVKDDLLQSCQSSRKTSPQWNNSIDHQEQLIDRKHTSCLLTQTLRPKYWNRLDEAEQNGLLKRLTFHRLILQKFVEMGSIPDLINNHRRRAVKRKLATYATPDSCLEGLTNRLEVIIQKNYRSINRLSKKIQTQTLSKRSEHKDRVCLLNYYQRTLRELEEKQLAESISYFQQVFVRGRKKWCRVHFEEALEWDSRVMPLCQLQRLSRMRQCSLTNQYKVAHKTTYSTLSFYQPANRAYQKQSQPIQRAEDIFAMKPGKGVLKDCYCHQCRLLCDRAVIFKCGEELSGRQCKRFYCPNCIKLFYGEMGMICFSCAQLCSCMRCQRQSRMQQMREVKQHIEQLQEGDSETHQIELKKKSPTANLQCLESPRRKKVRLID